MTEAPTIKIVQRGLALMMLDIEMDRLDCEEIELKLKTENNKARQEITRRNIIMLQESGEYEMEGMR